MSSRTYLRQVLRVLHIVACARDGGGLLSFVVIIVGFLGYVYVVAQHNRKAE